MGLLATTSTTSTTYPCLSKQRYGHADIAGTYPFSVSAFMLVAAYYINYNEHVNCGYGVFYC
jgi:hypothetical protein